MATFTEKEVNQIIKRFNEVAPEAKCSLCGKDDFGVLTGVISLELQEVYPSFFEKQKKGDLPCAALVCKTCGNTFLINLLIIGGLDDLLKWDV